MLLRSINSIKLPQVIFLFKYAADYSWLQQTDQMSQAETIYHSFTHFPLWLQEKLEHHDMWTSQHHRVKEMESLCSLLNMTTAPNYLVVLAETMSRLDVKDLTTMAESVTRDPMEDHCRSNDEQSDHKITANHLVTLEGTHWLHQITLWPIHQLQWKSAIFFQLKESFSIICPTSQQRRSTVATFHFEFLHFVPANHFLFLKSN